MSNPPDARRLLHGMRELRAVHAPASLLPSVLASIGLAESYWRIESPLGPVYVAHNPAGISAVSRATSAAAFEREFEARFGRPARPAEAPPADLDRAALRRLEGDEAAQLRYDLRDLSEFERAVLLKALEIPRGEVRPYGWIAREIGRPGAVRAVGSALGRNPVPLLIPCHRVVRSDGRLGDYVFGPDAKRAVLEWEGAEPELLERLARAGVRYLGNLESREYCFPTCDGMHLETDRHFVPFRSDRDAQQAGYHPCRTCRPSAVAS